MQECHQIPLFIMDLLIADVQSLFELGLSDLSNDVSHLLDQVGVDVCTYNYLTTIISLQGE